MTAATFANDLRISIALLLAAAGVAFFVWPGTMFGIAGYFAYGTRTLSWMQKKRLQDAILAREHAEGMTSGNCGFCFGVATIAAAVVELAPGVPAAVPFAIVCLLLALSILIAYRNFQRVARTRVAPLSPRSALGALPFASVIPILGCFAVSVIYAALPSQRFGGIVVAVVTLLLGMTAWRVAVAPALLLGDDPEFEYAVDERLQRGRTVSIAALACAPVAVLNALLVELPPISGSLFDETARLTITFSFLIAVSIQLFTRRRPLRLT